MKKMLFVIFILTLFMGVRAGTLRTSSNEILFEDMTTKTFIEKSGYLTYDSISKICSYDFCDYMRGSNVISSLDIFTENYLKTIDDPEVAANLRVKGIKITKVILAEK